MVDTPDTLRIPPNVDDLILMGACFYHGTHKLGIMRLVNPMTGITTSFYASGTCDPACGYRAVWKFKNEVDCQCDPLIWVRKAYGLD